MAPYCWWHDQSQVHSTKPRFRRPKQQSAGQGVELILHNPEYLRVVFPFEYNINPACWLHVLAIKTPLVYGVKWIEIRTSLLVASTYMLELMEPFLV
jgi:hypothetical protein